MAEKLTDIEAVMAATVFEDLLDQLEVMKHILPPIGGTPQDRGDNFESHKVPKFLKTKYEKMLEKKQFYGFGDGDGILEYDETEVLMECAEEEETKKEEQEESGDEEDKRDSLDIQKHAKDQAQSNLEKIQQDTTFLEEVIQATYYEILEKRTFESLKEFVISEEKEKEALKNIILKEEEKTKKIKEMKKTLDEVKVVRAQEVRKRKDKLAYLKNELQELKFKTRMEDDFQRKTTETTVTWTKKKCDFDEDAIKKEIRNLQDSIDNETRNHVEMESFIGLHQAELEQQVDLWMNKYDKDYEAKTKELKTLEAMMASDKERLEELTILYAEYEATIVEDRILREKERRRREKEEREAEATLRIQSWWRGVIIRKGMRLMKPPKKKKGKGKRRRK